MVKRANIFCMFFLFIFPSLVSAEVKINVGRLNNEKTYQIENAYIKLTVSSEGARIVSLSYGKNKRVLVDLNNNRLFPNLGGFSISKTIFHSEVISKGKEKGIKFWYKIKRVKIYFLME